jgi:bifunctional non-homologous end joining protein LigD
VAWDELTPDLRPNGFRIENLGKRLAGLKDPWSEIGRIEQALPEGKRAKRGSKG